LNLKSYKPKIFFQRNDAGKITSVDLKFIVAGMSSFQEQLKQLKNNLITVFEAQETEGENNKNIWHSFNAPIRLSLEPESNLDDTKYIWIKTAFSSDIPNIIIGGIPAEPNLLKALHSLVGSTTTHIDIFLNTYIENQYENRDAASVEIKICPFNLDLTSSFFEDNKIALEHLILFKDEVIKNSEIVSSDFPEEIKSKQKSKKPSSKKENVDEEIKTGKCIIKHFDYMDLLSKDAAYLHKTKDNLAKNLLYLSLFTLFIGRLTNND